MSGMTKFIVACLLAVIGIILVSLVDGSLHPNFSKIGFGVLGSSLAMLASIVIEALIYWQKQGELSWPFSIITLLSKSHIRDGEFDKNHSGRIIRRVLRKELNGAYHNLSIMGTTLNSLLGNDGILLNMLKEDDYQLSKKLHANNSHIRILILNPYSIQGIIRSISESDPFDKEESPLDRLMNHLDKHHDYRIYKDFRETFANVEKINSVYNILDCRLYNCIDPAFSIIGHKYAVKEDLILSHRNMPNDKLSGRLPLFLYGNGRIKDDLESYFMFVWHNFSVPFEEFIINLEEKYLTYNRFIILLSLQKMYWEKRWAEGKLSFNIIKELYELAKDFVQKNKPRMLLDLGCGDGGGGSLELANDFINNRNGKIHLVDYSRSALKKYEVNYCEKLNGDSDTIQKFITLYPKDMLSFLSSCKPDCYDCIYASMSIIYMPKLKSIEILKKIYEVLKPEGKFFASFFTVNYFNLEEGESQAAQQRPKLNFVRIPAPDHENLQIIVSGERRGEIRRFYRDIEELKAEVMTAGFNEQNCDFTYNGKAEQVIYLQAVK